MTSEKSASVSIVRTQPAPVYPPDTWGWDCHDCGAFMRGLDSNQRARESSARHQRDTHGVAQNDQSQQGGAS